MSKVYVGNLSWNTTWQELKDHCRDEANLDVVYAKVLQGRDGRSRGCGIVEFADPETAAIAIEKLTDTELDGRKIFLREDREPNSDRDGGYNRGGGNRGGYGRPPPQSSERGDYDRGEKNESIEPGSQLFVGNLSWETGWQDLKDHFNQCGTVLRSDVAEERGGRKKGFGFIRYATAEDASKAIEELNGVEFMGRPLEVRLDHKA